VENIYRIAWTHIGIGCTEEALALPAARMCCKVIQVITTVTIAKLHGTLAVAGLLGRIEKLSKKRPPKLTVFFQSFF
jgi:hypothetical protein